MGAWGDFEVAAPELAAQGRELIERFGFVFLGTLRRDGGPRVNPAEAHFVAGHLALCLIPRSLKALDLLRDPRAYLHTPVLEPAAGAPGEFKLRGTAPTVDDESLRDEVADAVERRSGWRPPPDWRTFTIDVRSAAFHRYDESTGLQHLTLWTPERGVEHSARTYL
jgi:pyridoxamine 5'-phosphate oxidase-like protein